MLKEQGRRLILCAIILTCAAFMRGVALSGSDNFHGIAAGKVMEARRLLEHPQKITAWIVPAHGPAHLYLTALGLKLSNNDHNSAIFLSFLFGVGVLLPYIGFVRSAFDDNIAFLSAFIAAFFPLHVVYSALSTAETMFLFFLFCGLFFYQRERRTGKLQDLFLCAFLLGIATICRFEGGLFILIVFLLQRNVKKCLFFGFFAMILPVFWMWGNYLVSGNFMQFLTASDAIVKEGFALERELGRDFGIPERVFYWVMQIKSYFGLPVFAGGICALALYGFKKEYRDPLILLMLPLLYFSYKTWVEELAMQSRYGMSLGMLFLPYFALFLLKTAGCIKKTLREPLVLLFMLYVIFRCAYLQLVMLPNAPDWVKEAAFFLRANTDSRDTIYMEAEDDNIKDPLKVYSGLKAEQFIDYTPFSNNVAMLNPEGAGNLKFIVMVSNFRLKNRDEVFRRNNCRIYQVKKNAD